VLAIRLVTDPAERDPLVLPVRPAGDAQEHPELVAVARPPAAELADEATALLSMARLTGEAGETHLTLRPGRAPSRLVLLGVGDGGDGDWRRAGAALARATAHETCITLLMPVDVTSEALGALAEGLWLASYRFRMPPTAQRPADGDDEADGPAEVVLVVADPQQHEAALERARITAETTRLARDLTNMPSSVKCPQWFVERIRPEAERAGLTVTVREPGQLAAEGFGGILAVGGGSARGPRLLELSWAPENATTHVVLVGKGITFDTGGISIKPREAMVLMRKDMAGAAAVVAATLGAAAMKLPVRITTLAPLAENMVSGTAFRPGDVVRHYGGITSETTNSDAEGRLVLADALAYAVSELRPDLVVDLATLTGANAVALGKHTGALYSDDDTLAAGFLAAADAAGERAWRLPLPADYVPYLRSDIADLYSAPLQGAGSVTAALFLREFLGDLRDRWLHVDMSAPSWAYGDQHELVSGATGWGVRSLLRWLPDLA